MKQLKVSSNDLGSTCEAAWEEACVLDRCRGRPRIAQLLDIDMTPREEQIMYRA